MITARYRQNFILLSFGSFAILISIFMIVVLYFSLESTSPAAYFRLRDNRLVSNHNNISNEDIYERYRRKVGARKRPTVLYNNTTLHPTTISLPKAVSETTPETTFVIPQNVHSSPPIAPISNPNKVAIMVIYVGNSLPTWFRTFSLSVEIAVNPLLHWIIFVTEAYEIDDSFQNIKIIRITRDDLYKRLTRLDEFSDAITYMKNLIEHAPYSLVEFKPCLATVFQVQYATLYDRCIYYFDY